MSTSDLAIWVEIITPIGAVLIALWRYERRLIRRLDKQDGDIANVATSLDKQFGTNGFVLKNEIRGLRADVNRQTVRLDEHLADHSQSG